MPELVPPHGSETVKALLLPETERSEERKRAEKLRKVPLESRAVSDVFMLAMGAYTPLDGFMGHADWRGSCLDMKLTNGVFWPIPITLPVSRTLPTASVLGKKSRSSTRRPVKLSPSCR